MDRNRPEEIGTQELGFYPDQLGLMSAFREE